MMTNFDLQQQKASTIPTGFGIDYAGLPKFAKKTAVAGIEEETKTFTSIQEDCEGWLQLGFRSRTSNLEYAPIDQPIRHNVLRPTMELNLFSGPPETPPLTLPTMAENSLVTDHLLPYQMDSSSSPAKEINLIPNISNVLPPAPMTSYNLWQFGCPMGFAGEEMKVVWPSSRSHIGLWLEIHAAKDQLKESLMLPQILKRYIRIKDVKMPVRLVMKFLANKLRLEDESEVEITCRGLQLPPFFTLQHVRDCIWFSRDPSLLHYSGSHQLPDSPDSIPVMILNYSRRCPYTVPVITQGEIGS